MHPIRKVAVILQLWQNFDRGILQGIAAYVQERRNWSVFVEEVEHQRIPDFRAWDGDGLIVNFDNAHVVRALHGVEKPIIAVGGGRGWHDPGSGIPFVATGVEAIGRIAAEHLLDRGLKHFAFCGYPESRTNVWMLKRKQGFTNRLAESGFDCQVFLGRHSTAAHWQRVLHDLSAWLRKLPLPVGIMGCYDYRARHVLEACKLVGLRVPDDVAVIGVDNDVVCELADPPLSSVEQGRFQIGYTVANTLDQLMSGKTKVPALQVIAPVGVVSRQSTDLLCVADPVLAKALSLIRDKASRSIDAASVCRHVELSRSTLDKRFKDVIGRSIDQEIRRVRLARACELLARTNLPLRLLAKESGFGSEQYLSAVFSKQLGSTPAQYRIDHRDAANGRAV
jgi:LacI family transcriptional regulator